MHFFDIKDKLCGGRPFCGHDSGSLTWRLVIVRHNGRSVINFRGRLLHKLQLINSAFSIIAISLWVLSDIGCVSRGGDAALV